MDGNRLDPQRPGRRVDKLKIKSFHTRQDMGRAAAIDIAGDLRQRLAQQDNVRMIFASAPSQADVLTALLDQPDVDWQRVTAFHMDEYIGLPENAPQRFAVWLTDHLFSKVPLAAFHRIVPDADPDRIASEYAALLAEAPIDIAQLGIGNNGHIAFNDPPVADFNDPLDVKIVELDRECRQQQVDDACFEALDDVPSKAVTLTIPRLLRVDRMFCVVPTQAKREAVDAALNGPVSTACPASILRHHPDCTLYLDAGSDPEA